MMSLNTIIAVASGGAIGATLRFTISHLFAPYNHSFPFATLTANLLGALLMGMLFAYFQHHPHLSNTLKLFLMTGILGALTTYSTFALETFLLFETGAYLKMVLNMLFNLLGTVTFTALGYNTLLHLTK
jgi:CrcB protein